MRYVYEVKVEYIEHCSIGPMDSIRTFYVDACDIESAMTKAENALHKFYCHGIKIEFEGVVSAIRNHVLS